MPLYNFGNDILKAFFGGQELSLGRKRQEDQVRQHELDREARVKDAEARLKQDDEQFKANLDLTKALRNIEMTAAKQKIAQGIAETGITGGLPVVDETTTTPEEDLANLNKFSNRFNPVAPRYDTSVKGPALKRNITMPDGSVVNVPDPISYASQKADQARILNQPKIEGAIEQARGIAEAEAPFKNQLVQMQAQVKAFEANERYKNQLNLIAQRDKFAKENIRLRVNLRPSETNKDMGKLLSPDEASKLGVPYGTTKGEAAKMGITPRKPLSAAEQAKRNALLLMRKEIGDLLAMGDETKFNAHVPYGGFAVRVGNKLGLTTENDSKYIALLGSMTAEELHSKYGSVLSAGELQRSVSFIPELGEAGQTARNKLVNMLNHTNSMIDLIDGNSVAIPGAANSSTVDALVQKYSGGGK